MFRLEKLEISGFKSFADRTSLVFGDGITGVVGPNGCGKSNIAEAISWVLGEQSAKNLRGGKMEDVIFNGTRDRKPQGMAEVLLTMVAIEDIAARDTDADKDDESEYDEVVSKAEHAATAARALVEEMKKAESGENTAPVEASASTQAGDSAAAAVTTEVSTARLEAPGAEATPEQTAANAEAADANQEPAAQESAPQNKRGEQSRKYQK